MKYLLDEARKGLEIVNRRFEELANGSLMYHFNELFTQENYLGGVLKQHQEDLCALEASARTMDFFESGYDKATSCDSPVNNRPDTVEFWQYVINVAQSIFDIEESCQDVAKRWNESQHSYCDI